MMVPLAVRLTEAMTVGEAAALIRAYSPKGRLTTTYFPIRLDGARPEYVAPTGVEVFADH
jgi:hypothetical protein